MTETLSDLHRRYDDFIPRDLIDRADGLDPALMEARGRVRFSRERLVDALAALCSWEGSNRTDIDVAEVVAERRRDYLAMLEAFKRAHARRRLLENPAAAGFASILGSLRT